MDLGMKMEWKWGLQVGNENVCIVIIKSFLKYSVGYDLYFIYIKQLYYI